MKAIQFRWAPPFTLKSAAAVKPASTGKKAGGPKILLFAVVGILLCAAMVFVIMQKKKLPSASESESLSVTQENVQPQTGGSSGPPVMDAPMTLPEPPAGGLGSDGLISEKDRQKAEEYFQMGMFFYEAGKLPKAIAQWQKALDVNYRHARAHQWLLKAEEELGRLIEQQYQQALMHEKYMRYDMAEDAFQAVLDMCMDRQDQTCLNAFNHLTALREKK